ncbi:helix-turn-helix domain-containing protein [Erythrobacter sp. YT30]|uniref:helix-turn-helix transcriptional regulator n=1 Tax=Erythrobacter sp. YT30 TaxID=1735012 RepID=UPI0009E8242D
MTNQNELLTEADVAATLRISVRTLRRWHSLRKGPPRVKIGRKIHYRSNSVQRWIENSETIDA